MKKLILFGDSLFAQISKSELLSLESHLDNQYDVYNCAVGGWDTDDLIKKSPYIAQLKPDVLLLSVGTNDASFWKEVKLDKFKDNLITVIEMFKGSRIVYFLPPPVNEARQPENKRRSNVTMKEYYDAAKAICQEMGVDYTNSWETLMPMIEPTDTFHVDDGVHITEAGYEAVFEMMAGVLKK